MKRLSKSGIEYLDYQWGIFSGCHNWKNGICQVENCWAKSFAQRFQNIYPNGFEPTFYPETINSPKHLKKPSIIGVGWVGDVIGYGLEFKDSIFPIIRQCFHHTFLFLTKNPDKLVSWGIFPENCWVGVTATGYDAFNKALDKLKVVEARIKFISIEPLLEAIPFYMERLAYCGINWLIIGAQTKPYKPPKIEWVREIVEAADKAGIPVFLKDNLQGSLGGYPIPKTNMFAYQFRDGAFGLRQEMPSKDWC